MARPIAPENVKLSFTRATEALEAMPPNQERATGATRLFEAINGFEPWEASSSLAKFGAIGSWYLKESGGYDNQAWLLDRLRKLRNDTIGITGRSAPVTTNPATGKVDVPRKVQTQAAFDRQHPSQTTAFTSELVNQLTPGNPGNSFDNTVKMLETIVKVGAILGAGYVAYQIYKATRSKPVEE